MSFIQNLRRFLSDSLFLKNSKQLEIYGKNVKDFVKIAGPGAIRALILNSKKQFVRA